MPYNGKNRTLVGLGTLKELKEDIVESTFLRRRINVNGHTLSFYDSYS
jgi:hypothetical protein